MHGWLYML